MKNKQGKNNKNIEDSPSFKEIISGEEVKETSKKSLQNKKTQKFKISTIIISVLIIVAGIVFLTLHIVNNNKDKNWEEQIDTLTSEINNANLNIEATQSLIDYFDNNKIEIEDLENDSQKIEVNVDTTEIQQLVNESKSIIEDGNKMYQPLFNVKNKEFSQDVFINQEFFENLKNSENEKETKDNTVVLLEFNYDKYSLIDNYKKFNNNFDMEQLEKNINKYKDLNNKLVKNVKSFIETIENQKDVVLKNNLKILLDKTDKNIKETNESLDKIEESEENFNNNVDEKDKIDKTSLVDYRNDVADLQKEVKSIKAYFDDPDNSLVVLKTEVEKIFNKSEENLENVKSLLKKTNKNIEKINKEIEQKELEDKEEKAANKIKEQEEKQAELDKIMQEQIEREEKTEQEILKKQQEQKKKQQELEEKQKKEKQSKKDKEEEKQTEQPTEQPIDKENKE